MGLLIHTSFETPEGFSGSGVYCRIVEVTFRPQGSGEFAMAIRIEYYINRSARLAGRLPVRVPTLSDMHTYTGAFGDMPYLYDLLKTNLESSGFTVENVDPDAPVVVEPAAEPAVEPVAEPVAEPVVA